MPSLTQWTSRRMKQAPRRVHSFPLRFCSIFFLSHKAFKFLPLQLQWKEVSKIWNPDLTVKRVQFSKFLRPSRNRTQSGCPQDAITARDSGTMQSTARTFDWMLKDENLTWKKNQSPKMTSTSFLCYQRKLRMQRSGANERDLSMLICNRQGRWGCGQGDKDAGRGDTFPCICEYCAQIWDPGTFFPKQSAVK